MRDLPLFTPPLRLDDDAASVAFLVRCYETTPMGPPSEPDDHVGVEPVGHPSRALTVAT